jgi:hypothetical protein
VIFVQQVEYTHWAWMLRDMKQQALAEWRDAHAPWSSVDDLFAYDLRRVRIVSDAFPRGVWHVAIHCRARTPDKTEWFFWRVRRIGGMYVII